MAHYDVHTALGSLFLDSEQGRRHVAFFGSIPDALVPWMPPFWWEMDRLLALALPIRAIPMSELREFLDVPYWRAGATFARFQLTARDILAAPDRYADHWSRTMVADLSFPIMLYRHNGRSIVLDGYHRILKAEHLGIDSLLASDVPEDRLPSVLVQDGFLGALNRLRLQTPSLIADARAVARELMTTFSEGTFPARC